MLAQLLRIAQQLVRERDRPRPRERHGPIPPRLGAEQHLRRGAYDAVALIRVAVRPHARRQHRHAREKPAPALAAREAAALEEDRNDLLEVAAVERRARRGERPLELLDRRPLPIDLRRLAGGKARRELLESELFPRRRMPPRMRIVKEEVADEERGPPGPAERQLLKWAPSDEHALGGRLDEGEVAHRPAL